MATRPTVAWDELIPAAESSFILGDNRIREVKKQFREIFEEDHNMSSSGSGDAWGFHNQVTFIEQANFPTAVTTAGIYFTREVSSIAELYYMDNNATTQQLTSGGAFIGGMIDEVRMWSGLLANIPSGWNLCDGVSNALNLTGKFIRGIATSTTAIGSLGGDDTGNIVAGNIPIHTHPTSTTSSIEHVHGYTYWQTGPAATNLGTTTTRRVATSYDSSTGGASFTHSHSTTTTGSYGGATTFNNRPAYVELAFIKRS